jgi:hypothetical protein
VTTSPAPKPAPKIPTITVGLRPFTISPSVEGEPPAVSAVLVTFSALPGGGARFVFTLEGRIAALRVPLAGAPAPDPLWQHTCFEAFLSAPGEDSYHEYNFSPAGLWAARQFQRYREAGDGTPLLDASPILENSPSDERLTLAVELPAALLPAAPLLRVGLSAVIEHADGHLDYWALRHPGAQPDFHLREGWTLVLDTQLVAQ